MAIATAWLVKFDGYDKVVCTRARLLRLVENPFNDNNIGDNNSGYHNIGYRNSGNYNSGNMNFGYFCTRHRLNKIFNKSIPKNWELKFPRWIYFSLLQEGYRASWQRVFENADVESIKELLALPNFDYYIFQKITSITKKQIEIKVGIKDKT